MMRLLSKTPELKARSVHLTAGTGVDDDQLYVLSLYYCHEQLMTVTPQSLESFIESYSTKSKLKFIFNKLSN